MTTSNSPVHSPTFPIPLTSVWQMLNTHAQQRGQQPAIIAVDVVTNESHTLTYRELFENVNRCANYLAEVHYVSEDDHISFAYDNRVETILLNLSAASLGAACSPLDIRRDVVERMHYKLSITEAKVFITQPRGPYEKTWHEKIAQLRLEKLATTIVEFGNTKTSPATSLLDAISKYESAPRYTPNNDLDHVHVTLFTSGTTAHPKGAQLTSRNLFSNALALQDWLKITAEDTFAAILPLHHANSTTFCLSTLMAGGTLVLLSEPPKEKFWTIMAKYNVTITSVVQKIVYELLEMEKEFESIRSQLVLKRIQIGSDVVDPLAAERFIARFGIPLHQGYGLTEVALRVTGVPMNLPREDYLTLVRRNTIGEALYGIAVSILDEHGQEVKEGEKGEICARGQTIMRGYIKDAAATETAFAHGWFHTGDLGWQETIANHKCIFYHSRAKEIIKKGGAMLSPAAIDQAIRDYFPDLLEAASFGYPNKDWGEEIWMAVIFKEGVSAARRKEIVEQIVTLGKQEKIAGLPKFEAPSQVFDWELEFVEQPLPTTSTMKIQRSKLKEAALGKWGV